MANLNVNKVIYGGDVLIDLTGDSVSKVIMMALVRCLLTPPNRQSLLLLTFVRV